MSVCLALYYSVMLVTHEETNQEQENKPQNAGAKRKRISRVHVQFHVKEIYLRRLNEVSLEP